MSHFSRCMAASIICAAMFLSIAIAQTTAIIPANEAAAHVGECATVQGVVAKVFTSKAGNKFLNIGAAIFQFRLKQDRMSGQGSGRVLVAQPLRIFLAPHQRLTDHFVLIGAGDMPQEPL